MKSKNAWKPWEVLSEIVQTDILYNSVPFKFIIYRLAQNEKHYAQTNICKVQYETGEETWESLSQTGPDYVHRAKI